MQVIHTNRGWGYSSVVERLPGMRVGRLATVMYTVTYMASRSTGNMEKEAQVDQLYALALQGAED